jgi:hypothetical protein
MAIDEHGLPQTITDLSTIRDHHGAPDSTLQKMADWADRTGQQLSLFLTLVVSGGLISGVVEARGSSSVASPRSCFRTWPARPSSTNT